MEQMRERVARQYIPMRCDNMPVSCVDFAVVDTLTGKEVCRVWSEDDCRMLADLLNAPPISDAALSLMQPEIDRRVAEEKAKLLAGLHGLELAGSAFAQLRSTIAVRFDGLTENSLWFSLNKAFDDLASARAMLAQFGKENSDA